MSADRQAGDVGDALRDRLRADPITHTCPVAVCGEPLTVTGEWAESTAGHRRLDADAELVLGTSGWAVEFHCPGCDAFTSLDVER